MVCFFLQKVKVVLVVKLIKGISISGNIMQVIAPLLEIKTALNWYSSTFSVDWSKNRKNV